MARKRRLSSDGEEEAEVDQETQGESPQPKKKRVSSARSVAHEGSMEEDTFNCSQAPDFPVSSVRIHIYFEIVKKTKIE